MTGSNLYRDLSGPLQAQLSRTQSRALLFKCSSSVCVVSALGLGLGKAVQLALVK